MSSGLEKARASSRWTSAQEPEETEEQITPIPEPTPEERHAAAAALGRLGGKKGGRARAGKMTPEERSEGARQAARARWENRS